MGIRTAPRGGGGGSDNGGGGGRGRRRTFLPLPSPVILPGVPAPLLCVEVVWADTPRGVDHLVYHSVGASEAAAAAVSGGHSEGIRGGGLTSDEATRLAARLGDGAALARELGGGVKATLEIHVASHVETLPDTGEGDGLLPLLAAAVEDVGGWEEQEGQPRNEELEGDANDTPATAPMEDATSSVPPDAPAERLTWSDAGGVSPDTCSVDGDEACSTEEDAAAAAVSAIDDAQGGGRLTEVEDEMEHADEDEDEIDVDDEDEDEFLVDGVLGDGSPVGASWAGADGVSGDLWAGLDDDGWLDADDATLDDSEWASSASSSASVVASEKEVPAVELQEVMREVLREAAAEAGPGRGAAEWPPSVSNGTDMAGKDGGVAPNGSSTAGAAADAAAEDRTREGVRRLFVATAAAQSRRAAGRRVDFLDAAVAAAENRRPSPADKGGRGAGSVADRRVDGGGGGAVPGVGQLPTMVSPSSSPSSAVAATVGGAGGKHGGAAVAMPSFLQCPECAAVYVVDGDELAGM